MRRPDENRIRAAAAAHRLLENYCITQPADIRIEDIAWDLGIRIVVEPLKGARGNLIKHPGGGTITVHDAISDERERRFIIAHELGHWHLHNRSQDFWCDEHALREYRNSGPELEANVFASELLIPSAMVPRSLRVADPEWASMSWLQSQFAVSLVTAAVRYVELCEHAVLVAFSDGRSISWWRRNDRKADALWLESRQAIDGESQLADIVSNGAAATELVSVPWHAWFHHIRTYGDAELFEVSGRVDDCGNMMSLLWAPGL